MASREILLRVQNYNLPATLNSGQAFRWQAEDKAWTGVICHRWVRLRVVATGILAETANPETDWHWLTHYLQSDVDLPSIITTFPDDPPMQSALAVCGGLRLLRQDPWECLASFILSSTKQIVQIRQIIALLSARHGCEITADREGAPVFAFPTTAQIANLSEPQLRECKMGFRAPHLLAAARQIESGALNLERLRDLPLAEARAELIKLRGVGAKIADCVLLFAYGFNAAFPVDVWIKKALQELYFPRRKASEKRLLHFASTHFGEHGGYAQQYLFHYMRTRKRGL